MESSTAKNTTSYISKIVWIIVEKGLAYKQAASAINNVQLYYLGNIVTIIEKNAQLLIQGKRKHYLLTV